ncbi:MAG: LPXTG cell wall anchor domain-containing protein, partial [Oscillospiraceae bacterium]|nr:LPXTG cell wall anchor domain-containing protein [Oscillospiraceae bacterium]
VVYCAVCGEEVSRVTETIAATGHTAGEAVKENVVEATETKSGSYDEVVYCTVCGGEISRKTVTVPATGSSTTPTSAPTETPAGTMAPTETPAGTTAPTDAPTVTVSPTVSPADGTETTATPPAAPDGNTVTVTPKPADETSPKTGDGSDLGLWIGLVVLCGFGAAAAIGTMRKKSK